MVKAKAKKEKRKNRKAKEKSEPPNTSPPKAVPPQAVPVQGVPAQAMPPPKSPTTWMKVLVRAGGVVVTTISTLLTLIPLVVSEPDIQPVDIAADDVPLTFTIRNNSQWVTMVDTEVLAQPGAMRVNTAQRAPDLGNDLPTAAGGVCDRIRGHQDMQAATARNLALAFRHYSDPISMGGGAVTFQSNASVSGSTRLVFGVGLRFNLRLLGLVPLPFQRNICREFQTTVDRDGKTVLTPYK